jgi:hypothetical protein
MAAQLCGHFQLVGASSGEAFVELKTIQATLAA